MGGSKPRNPHALAARMFGKRVIDHRHHKRSRPQRERDAYEQERRDND